jgi:protein gp37
MGTSSSIEWTEATWNPLTGCTKISPGCKHCYAETMSRRLKAMGQRNYANGFKLTLHEHMLPLPLQWRKPQTIFVNSMSDLFHHDVPVDYIVDVARVMRSCHWHTFQVLTKRSERMRDLLRHELAFVSQAPNVWWGVSVENRKSGVPRIGHLRSAPAAVRFLSIEPLLEDVGALDLDGIAWVIVGGESGPGARPVQPGWVTSIRDQCANADVPFFFKQWGGTRKKLAGRTLDGRTHDGFPDRRKAPVASRSAREILLRELGQGV